MAWTIAAGALPAGLNLDLGTGGITGTPTASGNFTFTISADATHGIAGTKNLVVAAPPAPAPGPAPP